jgi:hypothetical protein
VSVRAYVLSAAVCLALAGLVALVFGVSFERAAVLAPVIVVAAGAVGAVAVLWTRVAVESLRRRRHPGRIVAAALAALGLLMIVSLFVGPLPHE